MTRRMTQSDNSRGARRFVAGVRRAFTLLELLVVVSIIVIALGVMIPSYGRLIESTNYASSINLVTATLGNARAHAIRTGRHTAVAFLFDIDTERTTMYVLELSGSQGGALTRNAGGPAEGTYAQIFRPIPGTAPTELPEGTGVYALALTHVQPDSYDIDRDTTHWYAGELIPSADRAIIPWIFPRNDPRNFIARLRDQDTNEIRDPWDAFLQDRPADAVDVAEAQTAVRHANTFMIQFSPEGSVVTTTPAGGDETLNAFIDWADDPRDLDDPEAEPFDDPLMFDPEIAGDANIDRPSPNPEVILRSANLLAVVDINRLAEETGFSQPWFVRPADSQAPVSDQTRLDDDDAITISDWIDDNAEIISFNRYSGAVLRNQPR